MNDSIKVNDNYYEYLTDVDTDIIVFVGGADSGKSFFALEQLLPYKFMTQTNKRIAVFRKVAATLNKSVVQGFIDTFDRMGMIEGSDYRFNRTEKEITLLFNVNGKKTQGNTIYFLGMDDRAKIKSIKGITDIFVEEAGEFNLKDYNQLTMRLRDRDGNNPQKTQMFLMYNPQDEWSWQYKLFEELQDKEKSNIDVYKRFSDFEHKELRQAPKKWSFDMIENIKFGGIELDEAVSVKVFRSNYQDNLFVDKKRIAQIERLKKTDIEEWRQYALGLAADKDELVFKNWKIGIPEDIEHWNGKYRIGLDTGFTNPSACIEIIKDEKELESGAIVKRLYVSRELIYSSGLQTADIIFKLKEIGITDEVIICDSAEPDRIAEMKRYKIRARPVKKGKGSKYAGIKALRGYEIFIDPSCVNVINEFRNYKFKVNKDGQVLDEVVDKNNHSIDAISYAERTVFATATI